MSYQALNLANQIRLLGQKPLRPHIFDTLTEQMKQAQDITEKLKAENALEWVGRMNNIRACAREIVERKIIYA